MPISFTIASFDTLTKPEIAALTIPTLADTCMATKHGDPATLIPVLTFEPWFVAWLSNAL